MATAYQELLRGTGKKRTEPLRYGETEEEYYSESLSENIENGKMNDRMFYSAPKTDGTTYPMTFESTNNEIVAKADIDSASPGMPMEFNEGQQKVGKRARGKIVVLVIGVALILLVLNF